MKSVERSAIQAKSSFDGLEGLRGIAALLVIFYHIPKWNPILSLGLINSSYLMVELFFVLSGFVISNAYSSRINTLKDLLRFQYLRLSRLYPVHILFLLVFIFIELLKYVAESQYGIHSLNSEPFGQNNFVAMFQHFFLTQAVFPGTYAQSFNVPAWSISVEFYTYLIYGLIVLIFGRFKDYIFLLLAISTLMVLVTTSHLEFGQMCMVRCFAGFFLGCLITKLNSYVSFKISSLISSFVFILMIAFIQFKPDHEYDVFVYLFASLLIITIVKSTGGGVNIILTSRFVSWLGAISYSSYMCHAAVLWFTNQVIRALLHKKEYIVDGKSVPYLTPLETLLFCTVSIGLILIVSNLVHKYIEQPFRDKSRIYAYSKMR